MRNLATVLVTDKESGQSAEVKLDELTNLTNSVVMLSVGPDEIASIEAQSGDLLITLNSGEAIIIAGFFETPEGERNELVLEDANGILWWGQYDSPWSEFSFAEINLLDEAAKDQEIGWWLIAAGLGGAAAIAAAAGGGGGGGSSSSSPSQPEEDTTPPDAPSAWFNETGDAVSGEAEPGSTVIVRDEDGNVLGSTTADEDGSYTVELDPALTDGEEVTVTATDAAGNESEPTSATAPDTTAPDAPTAEFNDAGDAVSGEAEPGSTVIVRDEDGNVLGTAEADPESGEYTVELDPALTDGEEVTVTATDAAGNESEPTSATAPDTTAPDAPTAEFNDAGDAVSGEAEPGSTVIVRDEDGNVLGSTTADEDGSYTVDLDEPLTNGEEVTVTATDAAGNESEPTSATAPDTTAPDAPTAEFNDAGDAVSGEAEPGSTVIVRDEDGNELGRTTADEDGSYTVELDEPLTNGEEVTVTATDEAGNESEPTSATAPDTTAPDAPTAEFNDAGDAVSGVAEPGSTVTVYDEDGNVLGSTTADEDGSYTVELDPALTDGEEVTVTATDAAGNESEPTSATAPDTTAPDAPTAEFNDAGDAVSGEAEPGSTVIVRDEDGNELGSTTADEDGSYTVELDEPLTNGEAVEVTATDAAGNESEPTAAIAPVADADLTVAATVANDAATVDVEGTSTDVAEGGEVAITITDQNGDTVTATATVDAEGNYSLTDIDVSDLRDGELTIDAVATDNNGNPVTATVTAELDAVEAELTVNASVDNDATTVDIDGTSTDVAEGGEVAITITDENGDTVETTATVDAEGNYSLTDIDVSALRDGELTIDAVATDNNGNELTANTSVELDAVEAELTVNASVDNDATTVDIDGTSTDVAAGGEVAITITDQNGDSVTATATVDAEGNYSVAGVEVSDLTDGPLTIDAVATDNNGNELTASTNVELDAVEAELTVNASVDNDAATVDVEGTSTDVAEGGEVAITITDQNGDSVTATAAVDENGDFSAADIDVSDLTDGPLTIEAVATDNNGNPVTATVTAELDAVEADLTVNASVDNDDATVDVEGTSTDVAAGGEVAITITDENGDTVETTATVDAEGNYSVAGVDVSDLRDGELTIDAVATDNNGNELTANTSVELDAVEAELTVSALVDNDAATVDIEGSSADVAEGGEVAITITDENGDSVTATATVDAEGNYSLTDIDVSDLRDGELTIDAVATDNNGNELTANTSVELDAVEAELTVNASVDNDATTVDIDGTSTDVAAGGEVAITITDQNGDSVTATATVDAEGNYSVAGVEVSDLTDGPLTIDAVATDNNGNELTASTNVELDAVEAELTVNASVDNDAATVDVEGTSTDVAEGGEVAITITDQNGDSVTATAAVDENGDFSAADIDVSDLTDGPLTIEAVATDNNGNPVTATVTAELDAVEADLTVNASVDNDDATVDVEGTSTDVAAGGEVAITITDENGDTVETTATVDAEGNYSVAGVDVSDLRDGELTIDAVATDNNGNELTANTSVELDAVEADLTVSALVDNDAATVDVEGTSTDVAAGGEVAITITDQNGDSVTATAAVDENGDFSAADIDVSDLTDGPLTIEATATDNNGNELTASTSVELDAVEADLTVSALVDNDAAIVDVDGTSTDVAEGDSVAITITDQNGDTVETTATVDAEGNYSVAGVDVSDLRDGELTIDAVATDNNGNPVTATVTAELDAVEADLTVNASVDNDDATVDVEGTSTDVAAGGEVAITITDQNGDSVTATAAVDENGDFSAADIDVSDLTDGPLTIEAVATDNNGNPITATVTAELDAVEAELTVTASVDNDAATVDIEGSSADVAEGDSVAITITDQNGDTVTTTAAVDENGDFSVAGVDVSDLRDGELTIEATATDNNGNPVTATVTAELDAVEAELTVNALVDNDAATVDVEGTSTDVAEDGEVAITITDQNGDSVTATAAVDENGDFSAADIDVSDLTDGPLTIEATATDNNGNPVTATVTAELDAVEAELTVTASVDNDTATVDIDGTSTDVAAGGEVAITITDQNGDTVTTTAAVDESGDFSVAGVDVSDLRDGELTIDAVATDNNGNELTASTNVELDAVEAELTVSALVDNDDATVDIDGTSTDVAAGGEVAITITDQNGDTVETTATVDAEGNYSVAGVDVSDLRDGELTIEATATDNNGNELTASTSVELDAVEAELTVNALVDNDAATVDVEGTSTDVAEDGEVAITITDQNGDSVTATAAVDENGDFSAADIDVSDLTDGPLTIEAVATDNNGNPVTATVTAELDAVEAELTVSALVDNDAAIVDVDGTSTDVAEGDSVAITITDQNGDTVETTATVDAEGNYSVAGVDVSDLRDGELTIEAVATDNNGNPVTATVTAELDAVEAELTVTASVDNDAATVDIEGSSADVAEGGEVAITITDQNGDTVETTATVDAEGNYSVAGVDVSDLRDGELTIEATATDNNGNPVTATVTAELDAVEADLTVSALVDNDAATVDVEGTSTDVAEGGEVAITITDQNGDSVTATAAVDENGDFSVAGVDVSDLTDGPLTIEAVATDNNGNELTASTNVELDVVLELPPAPDLALANDTGTDGDGITSDGTVNVGGLEESATWEYSTDGGATWTEGTGTSFELPEGDYAVGAVIARQTVDVLTSPEGALGAVEIVELKAVDDAAELDMGEQSVTVYPSETEENVQVLGVAEGEGGELSDTTFTVAEGQTGEVAIQIQQTALVAVADAFRVEVYDADDNLVYVGGTDDSLVGDVGGLEILGLTGDDTLTAVLTDLAPGEYSVVVRNEQSALENLLVSDSEDGGLVLEELGDAGVVLGPENEEVVLSAVEDALNDPLLGLLDPALGTIVRGILEGVLETTETIGVGELVGILTGPLDGLGLTGALDVVVDTLAETLLSNTLTAFQFTDITTSLTEYSFAANQPVEGNVITGEGEGNEADQLVPGSEVSQVQLLDAEGNPSGDPIMVPESGSVEVAGLYGVLTIAADGSYSYTANGDRGSLGESDTFIYTVSDGLNETTASLTIEIDGEALPELNAQPDSVDLDMGNQSAVVNAPQTESNVQVLGLLEGDSGEISGVPFTVSEDQLGEMTIQVSQTALVAVADAFVIEVVDAAGNVVFAAATPDNPLVGDVAGINLLGVTGDDTLTVTATGLPPGDYTVVVRNDQGELADLLTGFSVQELGEAGVILGPENQELVLDAVDDALGGNVLSGTVRGILELTLNTLNGLGVDRLVDVLTDTLTVLGLGGLVDGVLDAVAGALVSNTLTLLQSTEVTTTLTEYAFDGDLAFSGNVITGEGDGNVEDGIAQGGVVTRVENADGEVVEVLGSGSEGVTIAGLYGVLTIFEDGSYSYDATGARAGLGQEEVFTYTVTNGAFNPDGSRVTSETTLTINIDGQGTAGDIAFAGVEYDFATEPGVDWDNEIGFSWLLGALGVTLWTRQDPTSRTIEVEENTTQDLTINVTGGDLLSVGGNTSVTLEKWVDGSWEVERSFNNDQLVGLLGLGSGGEFVVTGITAGEYRVTMEVGTGLLGLPGSIRADISSTVTLLDEFKVDNVATAEGNLLENDVLRGEEFELSVSLDGETFESTSEGAVTLDGEYGTLVVEADGSYVYTPYDLENFVDTLSDTFTYQVAYEGGPTETAELTVFVRSTNPANELFVIDSDEFDPIDGEGGFDVLLLDGEFDLDFTDPDTATVANIERIDLGEADGENTLTLAGDDLIALTDDNDVLQITGDEEDTVVLSGDDWSQGETQVINGVAYTEYTFGDDATLLVQDGVNVEGA